MNRPDCRLPSVPADVALLFSARRLLELLGGLYSAEFLQAVVDAAVTEARLEPVLNRLPGMPQLWIGDRRLLETAARLRGAGAVSQQEVEP